MGGAWGIRMGVAWGVMDGEGGGQGVNDRCWVMTSQAPPMGVMMSQAPPMPCTSCPGPE